MRTKLPELGEVCGPRLVAVRQVSSAFSLSVDGVVIMIH